MSQPLAYHITFGTYGTRLHGDERGTVDRSMNKHGDPIIGRDVDWNRIERSLLKFEPVYLSMPQRSVAEAVIPAVCERGKWTLHACAAREDHVHVQLSPKMPDVEGEAVRRWLKRWLGENLSSRWPLPEGATWWAECGSVKWIWTPEYFDRVQGYIRRQQTMPE